MKEEELRLKYWVIIAIIIMCITTFIIIKTKIYNKDIITVDNTYNDNIEEVSIDEADVSDVVESINDTEDIASDDKTYTEIKESEEERIVEKEIDNDERLTYIFKDIDMSEMPSNYQIEDFVGDKVEQLYGVGWYKGIKTADSLEIIDSEIQRDFEYGIRNPEFTSESKFDRLSECNLLAEYIDEFTGEHKTIVLPVEVSREIIDSIIIKICNTSNNDNDFLYFVGQHDISDYSDKYILYIKYFNELETITWNTKGDSEVYISKAKESDVKEEFYLAYKEFILDNDEQFESPIEIYYYLRNSEEEE